MDHGRIERLIDRRLRDSRRFTDSSLDQQLTGSLLCWYQLHKHTHTHTHKKKLPLLAPAMPTLFLIFLLRFLPSLPLPFIFSINQEQRHQLIGFTSSQAYRVTYGQINIISITPLVRSPMSCGCSDSDLPCRVGVQTNSDLPCRIGVQTDSDLPAHIGVQTNSEPRYQAPSF